MHHSPKSLPLLTWACILKLWSQSKPFSLSCSPSSPVELLVMCDMGSLPKLFFLPVPPQILWYWIQGCLYINLWLIDNYFSRSLTNCIQHSSLFCLMRKRNAAWWTVPHQAFVEVSGILFLYWGRAEQKSPSCNSVQQRGCAWHNKGWAPLLNSSPI